EYKECRISRSLFPKPGNQANAGEQPEQPNRVNNWRKCAGKSFGRSTNSDQAAILPRVVDRPKPEFIEHARAPEKETGDPEGNNRAKVKVRFRKTILFQPRFWRRSLDRR